MRRRTVLSMLGVPVLVAALSISFFATRPAAAAPGDLVFSVDHGRVWSATPPAGLFDPDYRAIPGDVISRTFWVRTTRDVDTRLDTAIVNRPGQDATLVKNLTFAGTDAAGAGLAPTPLADIDGCTPLIPPRVVSASETTTITLTLAVSPDLPRLASQDAVAGFDLQLGLSDALNQVSASGCPMDPITVPAVTSGPTSGTIAFTGATAVYPSIAVAAAALGVGCIFVFAGRRRGRRNRLSPTPH